MVKSMAKNPIVFAMANPYPEITYEDATAARADVIMATGRSDYPNQVNNVLGFPFIFRGALDVRATTINDEMKLAASYALAKLAKEEVPESVIRAYGGVELKFGKEYIIPKPFDPRVLTYVAPAVAKAAMETGVARKPITDWDEYRHQLLERLGISKQIVRVAIEKAKGSMKRIVFPEGNQVKILKAAEILVEDKIAKPILLGKEAEIKELIEKHKINSSGFEIVDPENCKYYEKYVEEFYNLRQRKGITRVEAQKYMKMPNYFGAMMVKMGDADGMISGLTSHYPDTIRPALQIVKTAPGVKKVSGLYIMLVKNEAFFFADTTVNVNPTAEDLAEIAILAAKAAKRFNIEPKVAMLSFSNFGNAPYPESEKVAKAVEIIRQKEPDLIVDGEMQADTAVYPPILEQDFPFARIKGKANVLVFPNLDSGNIAYKLLWRIGNADAIGPILMGMGKPIHVLQRGCDVNDIVNMAAIAVVEANEMAK
jgi:malate dehydrogenase (oxaloacetate-decarboxylating)(NADP+)